MKFATLIDFSFPLNLKPHCMIINWPNFNIVVSPVTGRFKERERDGNDQSVEQSEHTQHLSIKFAIFYLGTVHGAP